MRLTLRTLLAYLDDRLAPTNAREIGQKIANSPFATELAERIKEVKRRRRLATADQAKPQIDANLIAEYLDDQLTPELVAKVEQQVLSSDALLAEVASAHEVLGLLRDPVPLDPRLRDRLYAMDPNGPAEGTSQADSRGGVKPANAQAVWKPMDSYSPSRKWPVVVAGALGFIWLVAMATDSKLFQGNPSTANTGGDTQVASVDDSKDATGTDLIAQNDAKSSEPEGKSSDVDKAMESQPAESKAANDDTKVASNDGSKAPVEPDATKVAEANPSDTKQPETPVVTEATEPSAKPESPGDDTKMAEPDADKPPVVAEQPDAEKMPVFLQVDSRALFVSDVKQKQWRNLMQIPGGDTVVKDVNTVNCGPFLKDDWFGVSESFEVVVRGQNSGWLCRVQGPSLVRLAQPSHTGLQPLSGRMILTADPQAAWDDQNKPVFHLQTGSQPSIITLDSATTRIAVEATVQSASPAGAAPVENKNANPLLLPLGSDQTIRLYVIEGSVQLKTPASEQPVAVPRGNQATWKVLEFDSVSSFAVEPAPAVASLPSWALSNPTEDVPEAAAVKSRLIDALAGVGDPGDLVFPLLKERNPQIGVQAARVLSLTRNVEHLTAALFEPIDESIHRVAIDGLSAIAQSSAEGRAAIQTAIETRLPMAEVEPTMELLLGLSDTQKKDPNVARSLMDLLANDRLATRTLAIYRMEQATGDRLGFHPDAESSRRREAIRRWQKYLDRNNGQLLP